MSDISEDIDKEVIETYRTGGLLSKWVELSGSGEYEAELIADLLTSTGIISSNSKDVLLYSAAANSGVMERSLKRALGPKVNIIAGDIVAHPIDKSIPSVTANAKKLPLADESVDILLDWLGASWHNLVGIQNSDGIEALLKEYNRVLKPGGILILDDMTVLNMEESGISHPNLKIKMIASQKDASFEMGIARKLTKLPKAAKND